jgi:hypothetical protein
VAAASADPGCWAGASAVFAYDGTAGGSGAAMTLGNALLGAADESRVAGAQLRRLGLDYLAVGRGTAVSSLAADTSELSRVCGLSFKVD